jgi:hypothetical protein
VVANVGNNSTLQNLIKNFFRGRYRSEAGLECAYLLKSFAVKGCMKRDLWITLGGEILFFRLSLLLTANISIYYKEKSLQDSPNPEDFFQPHPNN